MRCRCCLTRSKEPVPNLGETPTRMPHIRALASVWMRQDIEDGRYLPVWRYRGERVNPFV
jgi:hypothetical protein